MKKHFGIKLSLLGIGLIAFFPYAERFMDTNQDVFGNIIAGFGAFSPLIGLALCIAGLFVKDKENELNIKNIDELHTNFSIHDLKNEKNKNDESNPR
ncbi:MAG: hypothetical protein K2K42_01630 [Eubacterium sp.]|nr:hypothetical protein [Eubacterium sp.]